MWVGAKKAHSKNCEQWLHEGKVRRRDVSLHPRKKRYTSTSMRSLSHRQPLTFCTQSVKCWYFNTCFFQCRHTNPRVMMSDAMAEYWRHDTGRGQCSAFNPTASLLHPLIFQGIPSLSWDVSKSQWAGYSGCPPGHPGLIIKRTPAVSVI